MVKLHPEYVLDQDQHTKAVLLPFSEWETVIAELEELDEIRAYDQVIASQEESVPFEQAVREIKEDYNS